MNEISDQMKARQLMANAAASPPEEKAKAIKAHIAMTKYRAMVKRLQAPILLLNLPQTEDIVLHAILGIGDESGELISIVKRHLVYGEVYSGEHIKEELGDLFHYMMYFMIEYDWTLEDIMRANTEKLTKRYPDGFNTEDALKRRDKEGKTE